MKLGQDDALPDLVSPTADDQDKDYLRRADLDNMFLEHPTSPGQARFIFHDNINMLVYHLKQKLGRQPAGKRGILVGNLKLYAHARGFAAALNPVEVVNAKTGETHLAKTLRVLLGDGHRPHQMHLRGTSMRSTDDTIKCCCHAISMSNDISWCSNWP